MCPNTILTHHWSQSLHFGKNSFKLLQHWIENQLVKFAWFLLEIKNFNVHNTKISARNEIIIL